MLVEDTLFDVDTLMISKLPHAWQGRRNVYRMHGAAWASMEQDGQVHSPGDLASWRKLMGSDEDSVAEESAVLGDMPQSPGYAQLALRLGYGSDLPPVPRRPLSAVLLAAPP